RALRCNCLPLDFAGAIAARCARGGDRDTPAGTNTDPAPAEHWKIGPRQVVSGITLHSPVETLPGTDATTERIDPESYVLDLKLQARLPSPNKTLEDLAKVSPQLPTLLPGLAQMLPPDPVSPLFAQLYETKVKVLRDNLVHLDQVLSRHNFFDCQ